MNEATTTPTSESATARQRYKQLIIGIVEGQPADPEAVRGLCWELGKSREQHEEDIERARHRKALTEELAELPAMTKRAVEIDEELAQVREEAEQLRRSFAAKIEPLTHKVQTLSRQSSELKTNATTSKNRINRELYQTADHQAVKAEDDRLGKEVVTIRREIESLKDRRGELRQRAELERTQESPRVAEIAAEIEQCEKAIAKIEQQRLAVNASADDWKNFAV